jgi:hypothetical protein
LKKALVFCCFRRFLIEQVVSEPERRQSENPAFWTILPPKSANEKTQVF